MLILKIFAILGIIEICDAQTPPHALHARPHLPALPTRTPKCNTSLPQGQKKGYGLQFHLPFMDMTIQNERNLYVMNEPLQQQLFVLHGNELYQMFLERKEKRLSLVGMLTGAVEHEEALGAKVISWHSYLLLIVALNEYLEIYQLHEAQIVQAVEMAKDPKFINAKAVEFEPIQQLTLTGKFLKLHLTVPEPEQIMLLVAVNFTKLYGKLRTFEWSTTYFDLVEELTVPPIHTSHVIGSFPKYFISGRAIRQQAKLVLTIYEIKKSTMRLKSLQTLTVASKTIHAATFRHTNYLIACSSQQTKCASFRMKDGQFVLHKRRTSKELAFDKFVAGKHFLVAARQKEVMVFTNGRLDCYSSFMANDTDLNAIITHVNEHDEDFIVLNYKRPFHTLLRLVEIEAEGGEILGAVMSNTTEDDEGPMLNQHQHQFEDIIGKLRSLLLQRKAAMDVFREVKSLFTPRIRNLKVNNAVHVQAGHIGVVKLVGKDLHSPQQLLQRVDKLRQQYGRRGARNVRSTVQQEKEENITLEMPRSLKVKNLRVQNLIYNGSLIEGFHLNRSTKPLPTLTINSPLTVKTIYTEKLTKIPRSIPTNTTNITFTDPNDIPVIKLHTLNVETINGIKWNDFYKKLFLKTRDNKIKGRLVLQSFTKFGSLVTPLLNGLVVQNLFNFKKPQMVRSNILFKGMTTKSLQVEKINGLNFTHDIVFSGQDVFIESPVQMKRISVSGEIWTVNATAANETSVDNSTAGAMARLADEEDNLKQQYYTGKVILKGSLTINNLISGDDTVDIEVNGRPFSAKILNENYMLKNMPQNFTLPVVFNNAKITTPKFTTNYLNEHSTEQHLLNTPQPNLQKPLYVIFMSAKVAKDLNCQNYKSKVRELQENSISHGEIANITGVKSFTAPLTADHVMALTLNQLTVSELVLKPQLQRGYIFNGTKTFDRIVVAQELYVGKNLNSHYLNNVPLAELLNYDYHMEQLYLPHQLSVNNIVFNAIDGHNFAAVFNNLKMENEEQLVLYKNLLIAGNVQFGENLEVRHVNDVNWNDYLANLVRINENAVIYGQKTLLKELTITRALNTPLVNNLNLQELFNNVLSKSRPQLITGAYTFDNLRLTNLDVSVINDMSTAALIDTRAKELIIDGDVIVPKVMVEGNMQGNFANSFQFHDLPQRLLALSRQEWRNLVVLGNAYWSMNGSIANSEQYETLQYLHKHAVRSNADQLITGNVKLQRPLITNMATLNAFPKGIDLDFIAQDALLKNSTEKQVVYAEKSFTKPLYMQNVCAAALLSAKQLNNIDILRLNASLYRLTSAQPIVGPLYFQTPPVIGQLVVAGSINGLKSADIYQPTNMSMPPLKMRNLFIDNILEIGAINEMALDYLLANRITKVGEALEVFGELTFEHLVLNKQILLQSINGIPIDNLVFKQRKRLQAITGAKTIEGNLLLAGPAHILKLNGQDLVESYQKSVLSNQNYHFDNLLMDEASFQGGLVLINQSRAPQTSARTSASNEMSSAALNEVYSEREKFAALMSALKNIDNSVANNKKQHLLYLDYDYSSEISWQASNESIAQTYSYEMARLSPCERQILTVKQSNSKRLYLSNSTSNALKANNGNLRVKIYNFCAHKYRKVKSQISLKGEKLSRIFGMKKFIQDVAIYKYNESNAFLLLHALDFVRNHHELRVLKLNDKANVIDDWQALTLAVGKLMRLFTFPNYTLLLTTGLVNKHPAVSIYQFFAEKQQFKALQIIDGDYDIIELVNLQPNKYQLILSCRHCQRITIYEYTPGVGASYKVLQLIKLKTSIDKLLTFTLKDGNVYMLVLGDNTHDFYHLYKYTRIQGWLYHTYGYFHNLKLALPLRSSESMATLDDNLLLLLCGEGEKCSVVKAVLK